jgi:hypothetical protein
LPLRRQPVDGGQRKLWLAVGALSLVLMALLAGLALWARPELLGASAPEQHKQRPLSLSEFLAGNSQDWRVARLKENPAVLVIEFPSLAAQGAAMNRMAALLEKADAPRDRVLDDAALAALIARNGDNSQTFYQGHDYDGDGLSRFYALVDKQSQALTGEEARIRHVLVEQGLLTETPEGVRPVGTQAVITFTAIQTDDPATPADETIDERRRESVLRHEISHGRFYTRPVYREHCRRFWRETLSEPQREGFRRYLATLGYDRRDEELMLNEAQAFLLHTPDTRAFNAQGVGIPEEVLAELRTVFWRTLPREARETDADTGEAALKSPGLAVPAAAPRP